MSSLAIEIVKDVFAVVGCVEAVLAGVGGKGACAKVASVLKDLLGLEKSVEDVAASPSVAGAVSAVVSAVPVVEKIVEDAKK